MKKAKIFYFTLQDEQTKEEKLDWFQQTPFEKIPFDHITPDHCRSHCKLRFCTISSFCLSDIQKRIAIREVYNDYAPKIQTHRAEALSLEIQLSDLVNQAYGLTPEEIDLMWKTAPPRMPIPNPNRKGE